MFSKFNLYVLLAVLFAVGAPVLAQSDSIQFDTGTFIAEINNWLPMAISIAAIGVGIAGGFKLAQFVGRMIINAFDGRL